MATHQHPKEHRLALGPNDQGRTLTAEEFASADYAEPWQYERVNGRLVVMAPDGYEHQEISDLWIRHFWAYRMEYPELIEHLFPNPWVRIGRKNDRIGDWGVYLVSAEPGPTLPERAPDLMFEFVSPGKEARQRDYVQKRQAYRRAGIREYVVIDRFTKQVTVFTLTNQGYDERLLEVSDTYTTPLLPGLAIPLAEVFAE